MRLTDFKEIFQTGWFLHQKMFKKGLRIGAVLFLIGMIGWEMVGKQFFYQRVYGKATKEELDTRVGWRIQETQSRPITVKKEAYAVQIKPLKQATVRGKVVYIDWYHILGTFYRSNRYATIYDDLMPVDISLVTGQTAQENVLKQFDFAHEYRVLWTRPVTPTAPYRADEVHNIHTLVASAAVYKGIQTLQIGDEVLMDGYLTETKGLNKDSTLILRSAIQAGEISDQLVGGRITGLCFQFYVTKLIANGFVFE